MNTLNIAIRKAFESEGNTHEINKAYLEFIKANFIIPIEKASNEDNPEVLYLQDNQHIFLPVFTELEFFDRWAEPIKDNVKLLRLSGVNLLKGIGEDVTIGLDIGSEFYKEFYPDEIARMRSMILKLFK